MRDEAGNARERPSRHIGAGMNPAEARQQIGGNEAVDAVSDRRRILARQRPKFPGKLAVAWDDIHRRAAGDGADVEAGIGRLKAALGTRGGASLAGEAGDELNDLARC